MSTATMHHIAPTQPSRTPPSPGTPRIGATDSGSASGSAPGALRIDARSARLWRVSTDAFAVVGHVELLDTAGGEVFLAKRYSPTYARFVDHGRFWSLQDAVDCLRLGS